MRIDRLPSIAQASSPSEAIQARLPTVAAAKASSHQRKA